MTRVHLARAMVAHGVSPNLRSAFDEHVGHASTAIPPLNLSFLDALSVAKDAARFNVITAIDASSPAALAGLLHVGDEVVAVDGMPLNGAHLTAVLTRGASAYRLCVRRSGSG